MRTGLPTTLDSVLTLAPYLWVARRCLPVDISVGHACLEIFVYVRIGYGTLPIIRLRWIHMASLDTTSCELHWFGKPGGGGLGRPSIIVSLRSCDAAALWLSGSPQQDWLDYYLPAAARDYALVLSKPIYLIGLPGLRCRIIDMAPLLAPSGWLLQSILRPVTWSVG